MSAIHLTRHEWREVVRDTTGVWATIAALLIRAAYLRHRERRSV